MKRLAIFIIFLSCSVLAISDYAGTSGMTFLKMDFSPKASALGSACAGFSEGPDGMLSNPAAMSFSKDLSVGTSFGTLYAGISAGHLTAQKGLPFGKVGVALRFLSYGTMNKTDASGNEIGEFSSTDMAVSVFFSRELISNLSFGIAPFFASSSIDSYSSIALGTDLGLMFKFDRGKGHAGLVVKNLGGQISGFTDRKDTLSLGASLGASYRLKGLPFNALAQGDYFRDSGFAGGFGLEMIQLKPLFLRAGYRIRPKVSGELADGENLNGLTAGFGLVYKGVHADYSFQHFGVLGSTHKFGLAYDGFTKN